jgi:predicted HTH transcriptional regulator
MLRRETIKFLTPVAIIFFVVLFIYACQNKRPAKTMNKKALAPGPDSAYRLLTIANLELINSGMKVIAWFFETPQIFELDLNTNQATRIYDLLKEAKEKKVPVNVHSIPVQDKNMIIMVLPATENQLIQYNKQKYQQEKADQIKPPDH